jgi:hypothetical protein
MGGKWTVAAMRKCTATCWARLLGIVERLGHPIGHFGSSVPAEDAARSFLPKGGRHLTGRGRQGAGLLHLPDAIDTTTADGRPIIHLMGALAEFERAPIIERTQAGR